MENAIQLNVESFTTELARSVDRVNCHRDSKTDNKTNKSTNNSNNVRQLLLLVVFGPQLHIHLPDFHQVVIFALFQFFFKLIKLVLFLGLYSKFLTERRA